MDFKTQKEQFYNRFGLELQNDNRNKNIEEFKNGILNCIKDIDIWLSQEDIIKYSISFGIQAKFEFDEDHRRVLGKNIFNSIVEETDFIRLLFKIQTLFNLEFRNTCYIRVEGEHQQFTREHLYEKIGYVFNCSYLDVNITQSNGEYTIYPKGEGFLDREIVEKTLKFLEKKSHEHYVSAIQHYSKLEFIKAAESIRRCIEEFLREKMNNKQGLKANITELGNLLKDKGLKEIRNIIHSNFSTLDQLFNGHSKHGDGDIGEEQCEFLIYQSGLLMRYIHKCTHSQEPLQSHEE